MKKCILVLLGVICGAFSFLFAENVPVDKALQVATHFTQRLDKKSLRSDQPLQLVYAARPSLRSGSLEAYYYVFNRGSDNGFIIISGDDRALPVLGYTDEGDFSYEDIPDNMKWWLQEYADQIQFACTNITDQDEETSVQWENFLSGTNLPSLRSEVKLATANWSQEAPYYDLCPMVNGKRAVTGCVATAMAIVMKYHGHPAKGSGSHSYTDGYNNTYSANFATNYDWNSMLNDYSKSYTQTQGNAVAKLMFHCGVSCEMDYDPGASGALSEKMAKALSTYFGYDKSACSMSKSGHADSEWNALLKNELDNGRPVPYGGQAPTGGHAFVFAGYNNSSQYYVNWGWGGYCNGWFTLSSLNPSGANYASDQLMTIHVKRDEGGAPMNRLVIADYDGQDSKGLVLASTPIQKDNFTVNLSTLNCDGSTGFVENPATLSIAHIDVNENIKEIVHTGTLTTLAPWKLSRPLTFSGCKITKLIEKGDQLCAVYKAGSADYQIVGGTPNLPTRINLTEDGPSTVYKVTWNTLTGTTVIPVSGYDPTSISAGGAFKFKVTKSSSYTDYRVVVKQGTTELTADASGIYTITNIQKDIQLTISLESVSSEALRNSTTLQITDYYQTTGLGMITDRTSVTKGDQFNIDVAFLKNMTTNKFDALVGIALVDKNNVLKEVIGKREFTVFEGSIYSIPYVIECNITKDVSDTDLLKVVESTNSGSSWQIVQGNNSSLKVKGQTVNWCTITMPSSVSGVKIQVLSDYSNKVVKGRSFSFKADPSSTAYAVSVKANGERLKRSIFGGAFELSYITQNQNIAIIGIDLSSVNTTKTVNLVTAGTLSIKLTEDEQDYMQTLILTGNVGGSDLLFISYLPEIKKVDLSGARLENNTLSSYKLSSSPKLVELILPASVTTIEDSALSSCYGLTRVELKGSTPPQLGSEAFSGIPISQLTIFVPAGAGSAYRSAAVWKNYKIVEAASDTYTVTWNTLTGVTVKPESGYSASSIAKGGDFKFTVACPAGEKVIVKKGTTVVTPDVLGVYTLFNIQANIQLTITLEDKTEYTITMPTYVSGVTIQRPAGFTGKVKEGDSFTFKADPASGSYAVGVKVDGRYIYRDYGPADGGGLQAAYTIYDIQTDIVIEIEAINLSGLNTTKTVSTTSGNFRSHLTDRECCYLQKLIIKGSMNKTDIIFMNDYLPDITSIDFSEVVIEDNILPQYGLCFMYKLSEIILPPSITEIGNNAFCYDPRLTRVVMNRAVPPILASDAFDEVPTSQITIIVPAGSGPAYRSASVWKNYKIVEAASDTYTVTLPSLTGFEVKAATGYDASSVVKGADFKFSITPKAGYEQYTVKVFVNNVLLTPASGSVYTILNVQANQVVRIEVTPPATEGIYHILWRADEGATLVPESGYDENAVEEGDNFKFHIVLDGLHRDWDVQVRVGGVILFPDGRGIYTLSNIRSDKEIEITLSGVFSVTFVKPKEEVRMVAETGYNSDRVLAGSSFKFRLISQYKADQLQVRANDELLIPRNSVYTIYDMNENKSITVLVNGTVGNEEVLSGQIQISVRDYKLCIKHPEMKNTPFYITFFNGAVVKTGMLNGVYTEIDIPTKGVYIVSFSGFSRKVVVR